LRNSNVDFGSLITYKYVMMRLLRTELGTACIRSVIFFLFFMCECLFLPVGPSSADDCEIISTFFYERKQGEIVTDWHDGIAYRRYQSVLYPCVDLRIRDNSALLSEKEVELTATLVDGEHGRQKVVV